MRTIYKQLLSSMLAISVAVPIIILVIFNVVMTNNIQTTAKKELSSTMTTMEKLVQTSYEEGDSSELLTNLVAALTSTKLSGNTNFYILRNENISFKSDSDFEINDSQIIKISKSKKDIHREKINNYQCYISVVSLDNYEGVKNASMVFVTNTRTGTDNLVNSNVILMIIILICMIVSVVFSVKLSKSISNQIMKACAYANEVGNGIFTNKIEGQSNKEIEDLYKSLNHMAAKLKANDENQKSFYQNISHEFRNPLMSIQGYAEGIESGILSDNVGAASVIRQESIKLNKMVAELLTLSKFDSKMYNVSIEKFNAREIMLDALQRIKGIALKEEIDIDMEIDKQMSINIDEDLFHNVILNITSNCIRYAKKQVFIRGYVRDGKKVIEIYDDGDGTIEKNIPHLFERFYKGEKGNFGLGLAIAKEAMENMNGNITAIPNGESKIPGNYKIKFLLYFS